MFRPSSTQPLPKTLTQNSTRPLIRQLPFDTSPIRCPVHVYAGVCDTITKPTNAAAIKARLPHAEVFHLPGTAHILAVGPTVEFSKFVGRAVRSAVGYIQRAERL